ncbi:LicD family protein [Parabacteroides merdae]|uniref:LicD family protein n=1 Tax=Parabacteroides merdae TaxID=46503 RepID=UPI0022E418B5|nr:LicD family protein [Parabacteroides merdae]
MDLLAIYTEKELKEIQSIELNALEDIVRVCDELNIKYFLIGGSALGAIRHKGFIPWDDDIDIGMPREDYRKFLEKAPSFLSSNYHIQSPYNDVFCPYFYSKVRVNGTLFMEYCNRNLPIHHGVYVDIFPFDNVPDDDDKNLAQFNRVQRLIRLFSLRQIPDVSTRPIGLYQKIKAFFRKILHVSLKIVPHIILLHLLEKEFTKYNNIETKAIACLNFPTWKTEYVLKVDLYPLVKHSFGNKKFFIPHNWDNYLGTHYGDYMRLPEKNKRYGHKPYKIQLNYVD